jgi:hypothetical protein
MKQMQSTAEIGGDSLINRTRQQHNVRWYSCNDSRFAPASHPSPKVAHERHRNALSQWVSHRLGGQARAQHHDIHLRHSDPQAACDTHGPRHCAVRRVACRALRADSDCAWRALRHVTNPE